MAQVESTCFPGFGQGEHFGMQLIPAGTEAQLMGIYKLG